MNRKQREAAKASNEAAKQSRIAREEQTAMAVAEREAKIAIALAKPPKPVFSKSSYWNNSGEQTFAEAVVTKAPKLGDEHHRAAIGALSKLTHVRPIGDWEPKGKGRVRLFRSLCDHLLAKYPVPPILWSAFTERDNEEDLQKLAAHVAAGGSLYAFVKEHFNIPLTRKMCHELLATPSDIGLMEAIRRVQARAAGVSLRFFHAWWHTRFAGLINMEEDEVFWYSVLEWFGNAQMVDPGQVGPLYDYIATRYRESQRERLDFSMKGRTVTSLMRDMQDWHANLTKVRNAGASVYLPSGFEEADFTETRKEKAGEVDEIWRVREILTAKRLAEEGRLMGHCVYSYGHSIEKGGTSIWSVMMEDGRGTTGNWHMATLEVRNLTRSIVQARGRFNAKITTPEFKIIQKWAGMNNLIVQIGRW